MVRLLAYPKQKDWTSTFTYFGWILKGWVVLVDNDLRKQGRHTSSGSNVRSQRLFQTVSNHPLSLSIDYIKAHLLESCRLFIRGAFQNQKSRLGTIAMNWSGIDIQ